MKRYNLITTALSLCIYTSLFSSATFAEQTVLWGYHYNGKQVVFEVRESAVPLLNQSFNVNSAGKQAAAQGDYASALKYYNQALQLRTQAVGAEHPLTASILYNLGNLAYKQGQVQKAEGYYKKAAEIHFRHSPVDSYDREMAVRTLLSVYEKLGKKSEAAQLKKRAGL